MIFFEEEEKNDTHPGPSKRLRIYGNSGDP